jgi:hypothetical protein
MRHALVVGLALVLVGCSSGESSAPPTTGGDEAPAGDVDVLLDALERMHPDPWHDVSEADFRAAADELAGGYAQLGPSEQLVGLMRLLTLLGDRDGHSGIYPLEPAHAQPMHFYPLYVYGFSDGVHVTAAVGHEDLVGTRLVAVEGTSAEDIVALVGPLMGHDNASSQLLRTTEFMLVAEILHGLGVVDEVGRATFTFEAPDGARSDVEVEPIPMGAYTQGLSEEFPLFLDALPKREDIVSLSRPEDHIWLTTLDGGRALYVGYNHTMAPVDDVADELLRLARNPKVERIVVDVRQNGGGDNTTYYPLLSALADPAVDRRGRLYALIGRATFSAAGNFVTELERETGAILLGEPTGGAPNQWGDSEPVHLPESGWAAYVPTVYVEKSDPDDPRTAVEPDIAVAWSAVDFFAGRDPVLSAALRRAPR